MFNLYNYSVQKILSGVNIIVLFKASVNCIFMDLKVLTTKRNLLKVKNKKLKFRRLKNFRFLFLRQRKWANKFFTVRKIHYKKNKVILCYLTSVFGFSTSLRKKWDLFYRKKRFSSKKFKTHSSKSKIIARRSLRRSYIKTNIGGTNFLRGLDYNYNFDFNNIIDEYSLYTPSIWKFSKYMQVDNLFKFNILYSVKFTRFLSDFIGLYFFFKELYSFSRNKIFRDNKFGLVYGITHLVFFKTFFYLKLALISFFSTTHFKRHRLLLLVLYRFLRVDFLDFYKSYGFHGCEIYFFGKLGGFGGSQKKKYRISIGSRSSMSVKFRVHQHLYEYSTLHGRIGSKCKITLLN